MVTFPYWKAIQEYFLSNQGYPRILGYPPKVSLGDKMTKSTGYSQKSKVTMTSYIMPSSLTVELSAS